MVVVELQPGDTLIGSSGTEIISDRKAPVVDLNLGDLRCNSR